MILQTIYTVATFNYFHKAYYTAFGFIHPRLKPWCSVCDHIEGNNFFGMRCHHPGCGIIPKAQPQGSRWEVAHYSSTTDSVRAYIHTLNTLSAYQTLRDLRAKMRANNQILSPFKLAEGLTAYSIKGKKYVQLIQSIIIRYLPEADSQIS